MTPNPFDVDVVIIGAGFAGLTVSTSLEREGISVVVLEAGDRVGGQVEGQLDEHGRLVDTGAQFVNDEMTEVLALASLAGVQRAKSAQPRPATAVTPQTTGEPRTEPDTLLATLGTDTLQSWFPATLHSLAAYLAAPLGSALRLECPVRAIHLHEASVDVVALDQVWHAREVVVAVPPSAYGALGFTPPLPDDIADAAASFTADTVIKYLLRYDQSFWLDHRRHDIGRFLGPPGLSFADASLADDATLIAFVAGTTAVEWTRHSVEQRRQAIVHHAASVFGEEALRPTSVRERVWAPDACGAGGYSNAQTAAASHATDTLTGGLPLITFASSEVASRFPGYVEGAILAGQAASRQVLHRLRHG